MLWLNSFVSLLTIQAVILEVGLDKEGAMKKLDLALLMGGPRFSTLLHKLTQHFNTQNTPTTITETPTRKRKSPEPLSMELGGPLVERVHRPSITKFLRYSNLSQPKCEAT